jgi:hypothetical protein
MTRCRVLGGILGWLRNDNETVAGQTPAFRAMLATVTD